jgi:hypothetical protein
MKNEKQNSSIDPRRKRREIELDMIYNELWINCFDDVMTFGKFCDLLRNQNYIIL